jgi:hypothetical protein
MKSITRIFAMVFLFFTLAAGLFAQNPKPADKVEPPSAPVAVQKTDTKSDAKVSPEVAAWNTRLGEWAALNNAINAEVAQLKHANGVDILETELADKGKQLLATVPQGYKFDQTTGKLVEDTKPAEPVRKMDSGATPK